MPFSSNYNLNKKDIHYLDDEYLLCAILREDLYAVEYLLENGANPNARNHAFLRLATPEIKKILIDYGGIDITQNRKRITKFI